MTLPALAAGQPILPVPNEGRSAANPFPVVAHSPKQQPLDYIGYHSPDHREEPQDGERQEEYLEEVDDAE